MISLYPLKFEPILKEKIWGGQKLHRVLNKKSDLPNIGESWEVSDVEEDVSIVSNGLLKNKSLSSLLKKYKEELVGNKNYKIFGDKFPLLIKFIDAHKDLSVQLHPNDELAKERHNSFGKTEMWYIMQADNDSNLIIDFKDNITKEDYLNHLESKTLPEILNFEKVNNQDAYFIEVGRIHAICSGVLLAEIQQTSDVTYRVFDWDREDTEGSKRELHIDKALDAIDFSMVKDYKLDYSKKENKSNLIKSCNYFTTNFIKINTTLNKKNTFDSFLVYMCMSGEVIVSVNQINYNLKKGETILIPASINNFSLESKNAELLEVYV
ncbi:type I phosphomannose isomerase catalytic subunit [Aurantibacter sp.]|uniref:type I phosphomannose isomerase catalytic subunit n=1 Tax=Aurantibacter sp. TaxID=2807103 RepID=UPI0035C80686